MKRRVITTNCFHEDVANVIIDEARNAISENGIFRLALSGGSTPRPIYELLGESSDSLDWKHVQVTFGDERCVPPDHEQSNYRMARETLLDRVEIPEGNIFRMRGEDDPETAAEQYERELLQVAARFGETRYIHDLVLLGLGDDGHTASLFPGTKALEVDDRSVVANFVHKLDSHRITFTFPLINAARHVCFIVNDPAKKPVIQAILEGRGDYPAARVAPEHGELTWLLGGM